MAVKLLPCFTFCMFNKWRVMFKVRIITGNIFSIIFKPEPGFYVVPGKDISKSSIVTNGTYDTRYIMALTLLQIPRQTTCTYTKITHFFNGPVLFKTSISSSSPLEHIAVFSMYKVHITPTCYQLVHLVLAPSEQWHY